MASCSPIVSHHKVSRGSDRNFGLVFAAAWGLIWAWPWLKGSSPRWWALPVALAFLATALVAPRMLGPLNKLWFRVGLLLHRIVSPIVMAVAFAAAVVPTGLLLRALGKDLLRLKPRPEAESYWIVRDPAGPPANSMSKQF